MANLPKIQIGKIKKALKHIKADFRRFDMHSWGYILDEGDDEAKNIPPCGTRACFGGWLYLLEGKTKRALAARRNKMASVYDTGDLIENSARKIAGFTYEEANKVFTGEACNFGSPNTQYNALLEQLNKVFAARGLKTRV